MGLLPDLTCVDPPDPVACNSLMAMGEAIMLVGAEALEQFVVDDGCDESIRAYVSMGPPRVALEDVACGALVSPWLVDFGFDDGTQREIAAGARAHPVYRALWRVEMREACYPLDRGVDQPRPLDLAALHEVHRHIYAHGVAVFDAVTKAYLAKTLFAGCPRLTFSRMTPIDPQGVVVGWRFDVVGEVPA